MDWIEIVGIVATLFVLASFVMRVEWKIRLINSVGALVFVIYGIIIGAWSVWILNIALMLIHIFYLTRRPKGKPQPQQKTCTCKCTCNTKD